MLEQIEGIWSVLLLWISIFLLVGVMWPLTIAEIPLAVIVLAAMYPEGFWLLFWWLRGHEDRH